MKKSLTNRLLSTITNCQPPKPAKPFTMPTVPRAAILSTSQDIYKNLALEHWLYKHYQQPPLAGSGHLLMLWVNRPCVVIGRHQNPWAESSATWLRDTRTPLARRNSGGGTVYHDAGNLNLTFFTPNAHYHRRTNLEFIAACIGRAYALQADINCREDLAVRERKISGTAAKLARHCAYHHCTVLVDADKANLRAALLAGRWRIDSNATKSTKSPITNLRDECCDVTVDGLIHSLARGYLQWNNANLSDERQVLTLISEEKQKQQLDNLKTETVQNLSLTSLNLQLVTPSEENFPGLDAIYDEYTSWAWIYGKTPKFTASQVFTTSTCKHSGRENEPKVFFTTSRKYNFELSLQVENGVISDVAVKILEGVNNCSNTSNVTTILEKLQTLNVKIGEKYDVDLVERIENVFKVVDYDEDTQENSALVS